MKVCIVGGGNIGTAMAVDFANRGHCVNVLTSRPKYWNKTIIAVTQNDEEIFSGNLNAVTSDISEALDGVDYVFVTLPSNVQKEFATKSAEFIEHGVKLVMVPGFGGAEFLMRSLIDKGVRLFGLQRVPCIARLKSYGKRVWFEPKTSISLASLSEKDINPIRRDLENLFNIHCEILSNYLCVTLTPSNPVLHTARLYTMFKDFDYHNPLKENILFYAEWNDSASEKLLAMDEELQAICKALSFVDLRQVIPLSVHYESKTIPAMTAKLRNIRSLSKIYSPMKITPKGWLPDFDNRYFKCDFGYGLDILTQIAELLDVSAPNMKETLNWYMRQVKDFEHAIDLSDYGIKSEHDIYNYYICKN